MGISPLIEVCVLTRSMVLCNSDLRWRDQKHSGVTSAYWLWIFELLGEAFGFACVCVNMQFVGDYFAF